MSNYLNLYFFLINIHSYLFWNGEVMKEVKAIPLSPKYSKTEIEQPTSDDGLFSCSADGHLSWDLLSSTKPVVQTYGFNKVIDNQDKDNKRESTANLLVMSQISGPESKSKITPVSQIGFRDPAAVGASQQLTMLSIEVHEPCLCLIGLRYCHLLFLQSLQ